MGATYPTPATVTPGGVAASADVHTWRDGLRFLLGIAADGGKPLCVLTDGNAVNVVPNTYVTIAFATEEIDSSGDMHSQTTNTTRINCTKAGWYAVDGQFTFPGNVAGTFRAVAIMKNGVAFAQTIIPNNQTTATAFQPSVSTTMYLAVGDYIELAAYQNGGGTLAGAATTGAGRSRFAAGWERE